MGDPSLDRDAMPDLLRRRTLATLAGLTFSPWLPAANGRLTADQLRADVDFIRATLAATHPDLAFSADPAAVAAALAQLAAMASDGLTQDEAPSRNNTGSTARPTAVPC
jgi:hypothetical protein